MRFYYVLSMLFLALSLTAQENFNLELVANVSYPEPGNDIWGYVHSDSTEYAIVGTADFTRIYSLADPTSPREIIAIRGDQTIWRDMKSWEDHIYVTADAVDDGLLVIDMSEVASDSIRFQFLNPAVTGQSGETQILGACHNLYIDENGYCYLAGCLNRAPFGQPAIPQIMNKAIILDLNADRWSPPIVGVHGEGGDEYAHDLYVRDNIMYSSEINTGNLVIFDVTDKDSIVELGRTQTSFEFTHNAWISDDGNYVFTTDERPNANVDAYDISDLQDIKRLDLFQTTSETKGIIPHNTHYKDDYLITSWYTDGVVITDVSNPTNMVKVGSYDTYTSDNIGDGFNGCWGVYPWLPSGLIIANDINTGLYVLKPNYQRAAYLEGVVTDASSGSPINDVFVEIFTLDRIKNTNLFGEYKSGTAAAGSYTVRFDHPDYETVELEVTLETSEVTVLNVEMIPLTPTIITGSIVDATTGMGIPGGQLIFQNRLKRFDSSADADGKFVLEAFEEPYEVIGVAWGYLHKLVGNFDPRTDAAVFELDLGYQDDFVKDLGWIESGDASAGRWTRAVPIGTTFRDSQSNIAADVEGDIGEAAYVTGNLVNPQFGAGFDDIDDGTATLTSPVMFLEDYQNPVIEFRTYFFNDGGQGAPPNDQLVVTLTDGTSTVILAEYSDSFTDWTNTIRVNVADTGLDLAQPITISYSAADNDPGHLVEAALDVFKVVEAASVSTEDISEIDFIKIFPNPTADFINIVSDLEDISNIQLFNSAGQLIKNNGKNQRINVTDLESGVYLVVIDLKIGRNYSASVIIK